MTGTLPLAEMQALWHQLVRGQVSPSDVAQKLGLPERGVALYARFVKGHVVNALAKNFAGLAHVLGDNLWSQLADRYFHEVAPADYELNHSGAAFPEFVQRLADENWGGLGPAHVELAALEWLEFLVFVSHAEIPTAASITGPVLNPTVEPMQLSYAVFDVLQDSRNGTTVTGADDVRLHEPASQLVLALRCPRSMGARLLLADDARLFALKVAHDQVAPADAAAAAGLPVEEVEALLARADDDGIVILPTP